MPKPSATNIDSRYLITGPTSLTNSPAGSLHESTATREREQVSAAQKTISVNHAHDIQGSLRWGTEKRWWPSVLLCVTGSGWVRESNVLTILMQVPQEDLG